MKISIKRMLVLALILLPFESIPHIMPSIYRPIAAYPLCIMGAIYVFVKLREKKISKIDFNFLVFGLYAIISGIMLSHINFDSLSAFGNFLLTFIVGLLSFFGANYGFEKIRQSKETNEQYIYTVLSFLSEVYTFVMIIGIVELLCEIGILPFSIIEFIYTFSGGSQYNRVCLLSYEASWASIHIILMFILFYFKFIMDKKRKYILYIALSGIMFIYNMSGQGILTITAMAIMYLVLTFLFYHNKKTVKFSILVIALIIAGYGLIQIVLPHMTSSYYVNRLKDFTSIYNMIRNDSSAFVRLAYPYIAFLVFINNPIFGIGAGNFCNVLGVYINKYYPWALTRYEEVYQHVILHIPSLY